VSRAGLADRVELVTGDVLDYRVPDDVTVVFSKPLPRLGVRRGPRPAAGLDRPVAKAGPGDLPGPQGGGAVEGDGRAELVRAQGRHPDRRVVVYRLH
jgi:hypothetical protein